MLYLHNPNRHWGNEMIDALRNMETKLMSSLAREFLTNTRATNHPIKNTPYWEYMQHIADGKYDLKEAHLLYKYLESQRSQSSDPRRIARA